MRDRPRYGLAPVEWDTTTRHGYSARLRQRYGATFRAQLSREPVSVGLQLAHLQEQVGARRSVRASSVRHGHAGAHRTRRQEQDQEHPLHVLPRTQEDPDRQDVGQGAVRAECLLVQGVGQLPALQHDAQDRPS